MRETAPAGRMYQLLGHVLQVQGAKAPQIFIARGRRNPTSHRGINTAHAAHSSRTIRAADAVQPLEAVQLDSHRSAERSRGYTIHISSVFCPYPSCVHPS